MNYELHKSYVPFILGCIRIPEEVRRGKPFWLDGIYIFAVSIGADYILSNHEKVFLWLADRLNNFYELIKTLSITFICLKSSGLGLELPDLSTFHHYPILPNVTK